MAPPSITGLTKILPSTAQGDFTAALIGTEGTDVPATASTSTLDGSSVVEVRTTFSFSGEVFTGYFDLPSALDFTNLVLVVHAFAVRNDNSSSTDTDGIRIYLISDPDPSTGISNYSRYSCGGIAGVVNWRALTVDTAVTPDATEGTPDLTSVTAIGVGLVPSGNGRVAFGQVLTYDRTAGLTYSGGEVANPGSLADLSARSNDYSGNSNWSLLIEEDLDSVYSVAAPVNVTTDYFRSDTEGASFLATPRQTHASGLYYLNFSGADIEVDLVSIKASELAITAATGTSITNGQIISPGVTTINGALVSGTFAQRGVTTLNSGTLDGLTFAETGDVTLNGGEITATFDGVETVNASDAITSLAGTFRNSPSGDGVRIDDAPGTYDFSTQFTGNTGTDITIDPTTAGTYNLPNISVTSGYTLKIHNASATDAIVVQIPGGITTSTTTAGGGITVESGVGVVVTVVYENTPVENARVLLRTTPGDVVVLSGLTDSSGQISTTYTGTVPQDVSGWARRSTDTPYYRQGALGGAIGTSGYAQTAILTLDE